MVFEMFLPDGQMRQEVAPCRLRGRVRFLFWFILAWIAVLGRSARSDTSGFPVCLVLRLVFLGLRLLLLAADLGR